MLTSAQLQTLKAAILAETDPAFVTLRDAGATGAMADWFNVASTFVVWRTAITQDEITQNNFDWVQVDNLTVGQARIWEWLFGNESRSVNAAKANVRAGVDECWKGTAAKLAVRAAVYAHFKRFATRGERLFATGIGSNAEPGLLTFEGEITDGNVIAAVSL